jgi:hypothetical protein
MVSSRGLDARTRQHGKPYTYYLKLCRRPGSFGSYRRALNRIGTARTLRRSDIVVRFEQRHWPKTLNTLAGLRMLDKAIRATMEDGPCKPLVRRGLPERSRLIAYGCKPPLTRRSTGMVDIDDITESSRGPDNDGRKYSNNECLHAGNLRRPSMVMELCHPVDRVFPVGQVFCYVRQRTKC